VGQGLAGIKRFGALCFREGIGDRDGDRSGRKPDGTPECIDSEEGGDGRDGTKEVAADGDGMGREVHSGGRGEGVGGVRSEAICQVSQKGKSECIKIVITLDLKGRNNLYRGHMEDKVARRLLI